MPFDVQTVETKVNDSRLLVAALKRALRARAINYAQVASALNLSEATIKRQFSRGGFTLERFQAICALADTSVQALAQSQEC
jgi:AraC-like DNA-binding protein